MKHNLAERTIETIRGELASYLNGNQSLREFYEWFAPETTDIHLWAPVQVQDLVYEIKLLLAEYSRGHRSEAELKAKLRPFVTSIEKPPARARQKRKDMEGPSRKTKRAKAGRAKIQHFNNVKNVKNAKNVNASR